VSSVTLDHVRSALGLRPAGRVGEPVGTRAAVALILREASAGLELLFIHRAEHPSDPWSGQMAFPGGRCEDGDGNLLATAVRETLEEIGVDLDRSGERLGALDELRAISRMRPVDLAIAPFVFRLREDVTPRLSPEVDSVLWLGLDELLGPGHRGLLDYPHGGTLLKFPCIRMAGRTIWGLTYRIFTNLQLLLESLDLNDTHEPEVAGTARS
jgi:8-oxo-dGTP pyrophosphatase MutT (NUDIX family)